MLAKQPGFSLIVLLTLALGIGANTAIFSIVNAILLRPLPMPHPERLVAVSSTVKRENVERRSSSYPDFLDWRVQNDVFDEIAVYDSTFFTLAGSEGAERVEGEYITSGYFPLLGIQATIGRTLQAKDDQLNAAPVVVISNGFWKRKLGSDPSWIGRPLKLDGIDFTVVGVLPKGFEGLDDDTEIWMSMATLPLFEDKESLEMRGRRWLAAIAQLKQGVPIKQAQAAMSSIAHRLEQEYPKSNENYGILLIPFREELLGETRTAVIMLFGAVLFVLLIACANVVNLMLVRTTGRMKELALRAALGASRDRMIRQLITESLLLSVIGGALGLFLAYWFVDILTALSPVTLPHYLHIDLDLSVLAFTFVLSLFTGVLIGALPAFRAVRRDLQESLKEGSTQSTNAIRNKNIRGLLVISEIAIALLLLIGAGLMIRSMKHIQAISPGFRQDNLLVMRMYLPIQEYAEDQIWNFWVQAKERLNALPSVKSAAISSDIPLGGSSAAYVLSLEGRDQKEGVRVYSHIVSPEYFTTAGIPLLKGRDFTDRDSAKSTQVAIVSEKLARRQFGSQDPIGKRIKFGRYESEEPWVQIVGVAANVKHRVLVEDPLEVPEDPDVYLPLAQNPDRSFGLIVRTENNAAALTDSLRKEIQSLDRDIPVYTISTMQELIQDQTASSRFNAYLMTVFGALALVLASIGIYGVLSYAVAQRTREIGLRMALGARAQDVFRLIIGQALFWTVCGLTVGLLGAAALSQLLTTQLYQISPTDPVTYGAITILLLIIAFLATCIPARRAMSVDPMIALRYE